MPTKLPNVMVITTHDSGRHFGCYGVNTVQTPHIDSLAADGVRMSHAFTPVPICCASRASMMTGRWPQSHGLLDLCFAPFDWQLNDDEQHLSHLMQAAGYHTRLYGIQHEVTDVARLGFEGIDPQGGRPNARAVAQRVAGFLASDEAAARPFFLQVGFHETHTPFEFGGATPDDSRGVYIPPYIHPDATARETFAALQGSLRMADEAVGIVLDALRATALEENTIVVFTTDHGIEVPRAKWFLYDPGIETALMMRWPGGGIEGGKTLDWLISNVDFVPTLLELIGQPVPQRIQGHSYAAGLRDPEAVPHRSHLFGMYHKTQSRMVRTHRYKLIRHFEAATDFVDVPCRFSTVLARRPISLVQLFDLESDPHEFKSVHDQPEYDAIRAELDGMLWDWLESVDDPILKGPVPSPSYQKAMAAYRARA